MARRPTDSDYIVKSAIFKLSHRYTYEKGHNFFLTLFKPIQPPLNLDMARPVTVSAFFRCPGQLDR